MIYNVNMINEFIVAREGDHFYISEHSLRTVIRGGSILEEKSGGSVRPATELVFTSSFSGHTLAET